MRRYFETVRTLIKIDNGKLSVVAQMFISSCLYNLSSLLPPIATAGIIAVVTENNFNGIWYYVALYLVFYVFYFSMLHWNCYTYTVLANHYHLGVQKKLFEHVSNNDSIFNKISKGKIVDTTSDDVRYLVDVMNAASEALMKFVELIIIFLIFSSYSIEVALIALAVDVLYLICMDNNSKKVSKFYEGTRKYEDRVIDILNQMLMNLKQVKSLNIMPNLNKKLDKTRVKWAQEYKNKRKAITSRNCELPYIVYIGKILLYIYLAYLVCNGEMDISRLVLLISYFELTITCVNSMLTYLLDLGNYGVLVKRIKNILDYTADSNIDFGDIMNDYIDGVVVFDKVNYKIKDQLILNNVSFKAYPHQIMAIVGYSGSGKTTIIDLLYRLDRIKSGSITIDDENIYNYDKVTYASNVSGISQKPFIFEMSIRDNLSLADSSHEHQIKACQRVGIHDFIQSLSRGYDTVISEDERLLSDVQKQLLALARAILTKSEILLIDEATSNMDPSSTVEVRRVLRNLKQDHTIIMATHEPEMMEIADRVVVLDKGKVVAKGTNEEVFDKNALYRELKSRGPADKASS